MSAPIKNLDEWLQIATGELGWPELTVPAKERIKPEIRAHFEDTVTAHRAGGLTEAEAQARALTDLGDASAAAKRFRKTHLTEWQANSFKPRWSSGRVIWRGRMWLVWVYYMLWLQIYAYNHWEHFPILGHIPMLVPVVLTAMFQAIELAYAWIAFRRDYRSHLRLLFALEALSWLNLSLLMGYCVVWEDWGFIAVPLFITLFVIVHRCRLWFKIGSNPEVRQELPPGEPTPRRSRKCVGNNPEIRQELPPPGPATA